MQKVTDFIASETGGRSFKTNKYSLDASQPSVIDYDETYKPIPQKYGETERHEKTIDLAQKARQLQNNPPIFKFFLDGSRRTYRVDDIIYGQKVFPIIAGQIGVGCCQRENKQVKKEIIEMSRVVVLPATADKDGQHSDQFFEYLKDRLCNIDILKNRSISIDRVLYYDENLKEGENYENKGIAKIQDAMIEKEKYIVAQLASGNTLDRDAYLLKDGSLEYKKMKSGDYKELATIKNNYRFCVGASKSFNPEKFLDPKGKSNARIIAELDLHHRTPAYLYESEISGGVPFAVWYVRIHDAKYSYSPFDGILKLEKILITDAEQENGLDSELIDFITCNIINERNPTCYGNDNRWANHLYPIYLTELYIKSKYLSKDYFLNLF
jgi:hypothetical protein